jgi:aspartyl protease family protein
MGVVNVTVEIAHPFEWSRAVLVDEAVVDTGATTTIIPRAIADQLGLSIFGKRRVVTAAGRSEVDRANASVVLGGERTVGEIYVSDTVSNVLVGLVTLELLGFAVDPVNRRIVPVEFLAL